MHAKELIENPCLSNEEIAAQLAQLAAYLLLKAQAKEKNGNGQADRLLEADEAATRLGVKKTWLWNHTDKLPFAIRMGRKTRFSERGIEQFIKEKQGR
jgi:predicted DNA-binding transcriptional regulator AlpA